MGMASLEDALVQELLGSRRVAALASANPDGSIHVVSVWFLFDGRDVFVATSARTRKARNLESNAKVSLMIDSRDPSASYGINISGAARILQGEASREKNEAIHRKYLSAAAMADARVGPAFAAFDDITLQITPASVISWDMRFVDRQFLGGVLGSNPDYFLAQES
jgi:PPOX class probable F420-dependent enzyme